jgi:methionyl-tRNA synthetase
MPSNPLLSILYKDYYPKLFISHLPKYSMTKETFYVTTPIYYPNDVPHLGHAYTTIAADVLARWNKLLGKDIFFLTGTDEHGKKIAQTAEKAGKEPKEFVDALIPEFKSAWEKLNIKYDRFIRTTDKDHEKIVQQVLDIVNKKGDIYLGSYEGLYCTSCEAYYTEKDAVDGCCPIHKRTLDVLKEESYFFKLSKYQKPLLELYKKNPDFLSPRHKAQEVINRVKEGLQDLSISRTSFKWGIPLPFNKKHVCYVWFDALLNYYSATQEKSRKKFWPADVHIIGKDITWFHTVYWPAMLMSAGLDLPKKVFSHGWWTVNSEKMGKSAGNAIKIPQLISIAGVDSARYFLLREAPFGEDGDFSPESLIKRHNNELADKLGNLISRVSALAEQHGLEKDKPLDSSNLTKRIEAHLEDLAFDKALNEIFQFIDICNLYIQQKKPWETKDKKIIYQLADAIKDIAILLSPFIPETSEKISKIFNFNISLKDLDKPLKIVPIKKAQILFNKIEVDKKEDNNINKPKKFNNVKPLGDNSIEGIMSMENIKFDDFAKVDLRVATINKIEDIDGADKLYKLEVQIGKETRTICAGIKQHYKKEELKGKQIIVVCNLEPRKMKGIESQGMLLAAVSDDHSSVVLLSPDKKVDSGLKVS